MGERKATNKYYPPNFDPEKGSLNYQRRKEKSSGILPTNAKKKAKSARFEMPFDVWCTSCNKIITKGSRFNAKKQSDGEYLSTTIWKFLMKCEFCKSQIIMRTDPENRTYEAFQGVKMKQEGYTFDDEDFAPKILSEKEREKLSDPFYNLEQKRDDVEKAEVEMKPIIDKLKEIQDSRTNNYDLNSLLRSEMRQERKRILGDKLKYENLGVELEKATKEDIEASKSIPYVLKTAQSKQNSIRTSSIFGKKKISGNLIQNIIHQKIKEKKL